jgi:hypothetical protein
MVAVAQLKKEVKINKKQKHPGQTQQKDIKNFEEPLWLSGKMMRKINENQEIAPKPSRAN